MTPMLFVILLDIHELQHITVVHISAKAQAISFLTMWHVRDLRLTLHFVDTAVTYPTRVDIRKMQGLRVKVMTIFVDININIFTVQYTHFSSFSFCVYDNRS